MQETLPPSLWGGVKSLLPRFMLGSSPGLPPTWSITEMPGTDLLVLNALLQGPQRVNVPGAWPRKIPVPAQAQDSCWPNSPGMLGWKGGGGHTTRLLGIPDSVPAPEQRVVGGRGGGCHWVWMES